jgi:hypothetical protein
MVYDEIQYILETNKALFEQLFQYDLIGQKLAFLSPHKGLIMIGDYIKTNGYYHSNRGYCDVKHRDVGGRYNNRTFEKTPAKVVKLDVKKDEVEIFSTVTKGLIKTVRIDKTIATITKGNFKDFLYISKNAADQTKTFAPADFALFHNVSESIVSLERDNTDGSYTKVYETLQEINDNYYFIVKNPHMIEFYKDLILLNSSITPSKTMVKKVEKTINVANKKKFTDSVFFKGITVIKGALIHWYNHNSKAGSKVFYSEMPKSIEQTETKLLEAPKPKQGNKDYEVIYD